MTVVIVPTLLLWVLIALFALNGAASLYKMWLRRKLAAREKAGELLAELVKLRQPLTRQQIDDVMTQHYPLSSLLREEVDAFESCVRDIERLHGIGA